MSALIRFLVAWIIFGAIDATLTFGPALLRVVAFGPTEQVFTYELLQNTYGGRLTILSEVADAVRQREIGA